MRTPALLLTFVTELADLAGHLLWPTRCAGCDAFVPRAASFCAPCAASLAAVPARTCERCAESLAASDRCRACRDHPPPFAAVHAPLAYGGALTAALLRFKHGRRADLARPLGACLAAAMRAAQGAPGEIRAVLPVPLHPRRLRQRGFNQALELARAARRQLRHPAAPTPLPPLWVDLLRRTVDTPSLGHHGPEARRALLTGAFQVRPRDHARVRGGRFLLVDDVMTSGATVAGCAEILLASGASEVRVVVLARAQIS